MRKQKAHLSEHAGLFKEGEVVLLIDLKGRRYTLQTEAGKTFHSHLGMIPHVCIIGQNEGTLVSTSHGHRLIAFRPTMADVIMEMPRRTQVIYPKDIGPILVHGDIFPGAHVVEAGLGSGALTMALLRAVGAHGQVTSYEARDEIVEQAIRNIHTVAPNTDNLIIKIQDIYELGIDSAPVDRIVLDLPEPWRLVDSAAKALVPGGIFLSFLPTVLQVHMLVQALHDSRQFHRIEVIEVLERPWHVTKQSMRPTHRMVAHTGFITTARQSNSPALETQIRDSSSAEDTHHCSDME